MKYAILVGLIIGAFYVAAGQMVISQINGLKTFYSNADTIAQNIAEGKDDNTYASYVTK